MRHMYTRLVVQALEPQDQVAPKVALVAPAALVPPPQRSLPWVPQLL
jgi:hypothetical protein